MAVPLAAWVTPVTVRISPVSGAVESFARTSIVVVPESSRTVGVSMTAVGSTLSLAIVIVNCWVGLALVPPPLSVRWRVTVEVPLALAAGV